VGFLLQYLCRDVTVLVNDGQKTYDMMIQESHDVVGCNTNIRFHAERGDFSVNDATRAKIIINGTRSVYLQSFSFQCYLFIYSYTSEVTYCII